MGKQWKQWQTIFLDSKITADGDCSHDIKRCLLLERKAMTNLDRVLKSKDITLPTKVHLVKAMVFPIIMYGWGSPTIKRAEHQRIDAFESWFWRRLESPLDGREIKPVNPKGNQPWIFIGMTGIEALILWPPDVKSWLIGKDPDAGKDRKQEEKGTTEDKIVGWHHQLNGHEFEQASGDGEGQGSLACCSPWGWRNQTRLSNWTRQSLQACLLLSLLACRLLEGSLWLVFHETSVFQPIPLYTSPCVPAGLLPAHKTSCSQVLSAEQFLFSVWKVFWSEGISLPTKAFFSDLSEVWVLGLKSRQ